MTKEDGDGDNFIFNSLGDHSKQIGKIDTYIENHGTIHQGASPSPDPNATGQSHSPTLKCECSNRLDPSVELRLCVRRLKNRELLLELTDTHEASSMDHQAFGPYLLGSRAQDLVDEPLDRIGQVKVKKGQIGTVPPELSDFGSYLYDSIVGEELGGLLWQRVNPWKPFLVWTNEPSIPWEIVQLQEPATTGRASRGPFLCEAFSMTRWLSGTPERFRNPPQSVSLRRIGIVAPQSSNLSFQQEEVAFLSSLPNCKAEVVPARKDEIRQCMEQGRYDAWHFCGHGQKGGGDPNESGFPLDDGGKLTPKTLAGAIGDFGRRRPFVMMNACDSGRMGDGLAALGGWPAAFLNAGAGVFIGSLWAVGSEQAFRFSKGLYPQLLAGTPLGRAVYGARSSLNSFADPTRLSYVAFGHPAATVADDRGPLEWRVVR